MELSDVIKQRRSIRKFRDEAISDNMIRELLEAARLAPSGSNLQPTRFVVIRSREAREALKRFTPYKFIAGASVVFLCCADLSSMESRERRVEELIKEGAFDEIVGLDRESIMAGRSFDGEEAIRGHLAMNVAVAVENMVLKAVDLGLGSCWIGRFDREQLKEYLELENHIHPVVLLPVGYSDQSPKERPRFSLDKLLLKTV